MREGPPQRGAVVSAVTTARVLIHHWRIAPAHGGGDIEHLTSLHATRESAHAAAVAQCERSYPIDTWTYQENVDSFRFERDCPSGHHRWESGELPVES